MIKKVSNIILLGTSHVAKQSSLEIKSAIEEYKPEVVTIELDMDRFKSLMSKSKQKSKFSFKMIKEFGAGGFLFALVASAIQSSAGKYLKIEPGIDMKTAYNEARKNKIPAALIDLNIKLTLKKISKLSFRRKISMFFKMLFINFKKEHRQKLNFDLKSGVPSEKMISEVLKIIKIEIPDLYQILIEDRNIYMSKKLLELKKLHKGNILAVVGAGHLDGMVEYLEKELKTEDYNFSFTVEI